jgi:hypothetical protein
MRTSGGITAHGSMRTSVQTVIDQCRDSGVSDRSGKSLSSGNGVPPGISATVAPGVSAVFFWFLGRGQSRVLPAVCFGGFVSVVVATGSCDRSLPTRLLPTPSFARYRSQVLCAARPGKGSGQMRTYLVRIPHRQGHALQRDVLLAWAIVGPKPPHPRSDSSWPKREGSRVAPGHLRSNHRAEAWFLTSPCRSVAFPEPSGLLLQCR